MIVVREVSQGVYERVSGNPTLVSRDGRVKAPLRTILSSSWSDQDRAKFGIFLAEEFVLPEGKQTIGEATYQLVDGKVVQIFETEDIQAPPIDARTPERKIEEMFARFGVTLDDVRTVLGITADKS